MVGAGAEDHAPALELDKYEDGDDAQHHSVDGQEIAGQHGVGLGAKELTPS